MESSPPRDPSDPLTPTPPVAFADVTASPPGVQMQFAAPSYPTSAQGSSAHVPQPMQYQPQPARASQPPLQMNMAHRSYARVPVDPRASAALILGAASMVTGFFAGVPAFLLGAFARRDIDRMQLLYPHAPRRGSKTALAGMVLGAMGTLLSVAWMAALSGYLYASHRAGSYASPHPSVSLAHASGTGAGGATASESFGAIRVVDLDDSDTRTFTEQLHEEWKLAHAAGKPLLLQTTTTNCTSCVEIDMALHDEVMQRALSGATVVRVDVEAYEDDLRALGLWQDTVPWFYRLDSGLRPIDAISADEWDDNTAANIAPVLGAFSAGRLFKRRNPSPLSTSL